MRLYLWWWVMNIFQEAETKKMKIFWLFACLVVLLMIFEKGDLMLFWIYHTNPVLEYECQDYRHEQLSPAKIKLVKWKEYCYTGILICQFSYAQYYMTDVVNILGQILTRFSRLNRLWNVFNKLFKKKIIYCRWSQIWSKTTNKKFTLALTYSFL